MWGRMLVVINHAKFQFDRFRGFGPQVAENRYLPLKGGIALTTVYALTCYTEKWAVNDVGSRWSTQGPPKFSLHRVALVASLGGSIIARLRSLTPSCNVRTGRKYMILSRTVSELSQLIVQISDTMRFRPTLWGRGLRDNVQCLS